MAHANLKKTILATDKRAVGHTIKKITLLGSCYFEKEKNCLKSLREVDKYISIN